MYLKNLTRVATCPGSTVCHTLNVGTPLESLHNALSDNCNLQSCANLSLDSKMEEPRQTITLLATTGKTGRVILWLLLTRQSEQFALQVYACSLSKLLALFPGMASNANIEVFGGPITDLETIRECLSGAQTIFCALGENENLPGTQIGRAHV